MAPSLSGGLIMAEALMLELGRQIGRQRAHDAVYEAAQASVTQSRPFCEMLALDQHVSAGLTPYLPPDGLPGEGRPDWHNP